MEKKSIDFKNIDSLIEIVEQIMEALPHPGDIDPNEQTESEARRYHMVHEEYFELWHRKGMLDGSNDAKSSLGFSKNLIEKELKKNNYNFEYFVMNYESFVPKELKTDLNSLLKQYEDKYQYFSFDPYLRGWVKGFLGYKRYRSDNLMQATYVTGDGVFVKDFQQELSHLMNCRLLWLEREVSALEDSAPTPK